MAYPFRNIEAKWQAFWQAKGTFRTPAKVDTSKPKYYVLDMFPYPSGDGLHVGHPEGYTATDIVARYKRMRGFNVLHPMGWDAFGLPAEQYALKTGTHPTITTERNIERFREQLKKLGFSYDWDARARHHRSRLLQVDAVDLRAAVRARPRVSRRGPGQLVPGARHRARERGGQRRQVRDRRLPVVRRPLRQWMLKITEYADRLLEDLDDARLARAARRRCSATGSAAATARRSTSTSRPTTPVAGTLAIACSRRGPTRCSARPTWCSRPSTRSSTKLTTPAQRAAVDAYREQASRKSELERTELPKDKTGVFTGAFAINPATNGTDPDLDRRLRARELRHRRDHGRARARRARLRVRAEVRAADHPHRATAEPTSTARARTSATARTSTAASSTA